MMVKYMNPCVDYGFKKIFGQEGSKKALSGFLNAVLSLKDPIEDLVFQNAEQLGPSPLSRAVVYDIYCRDVKGAHFIVELQNSKQTYFKDRMIFYSTFPIQKQFEDRYGKKVLKLDGSWDFSLKAVYCVAILGFSLPPISNESSANIQEEVLRENEYFHDVRLKNQYNQVFYDKLQYVFIELKKFNKSLAELISDIDKWLFFLKNVENMQDFPPEVFVGEGFKV